MSASNEGEDWNRYLASVGRFQGDDYLLRPEELAAILAQVHQLDAVKIELTTAFQRSFSQHRGEKGEPADDDPVAQIKSALTNAIIMQNRISKQTGQLMGLIEKGIQQGLLGEIAVDEAALRTWVDVVKAANRRIQGS